MDETYYVRQRGKVSGPFDMDHLRRLRDQGRLARIHELSCDGEDWQPAYTVPAIFKVATPQATEPTALLQPPPPPVAADAGRQWYYADAGDKRGPITLAELKSLIKRRELEDDPLVWTSDYHDWLPASDVPQLARLFTPHVGDHGHSGETRASMSSCRECGSEMHVSARSCPHCGAVQREARGKSKYVASGLAFTLGGLGVHRFYLGSWWGVIYLPATLALAFLPLPGGAAMGLFAPLLPSCVAAVEGLVFLRTSAARWADRYGG